MSFTLHVVIPARYASTRLPGKPLLDIAGKPMIRHVYERAVESGAQSVVIATDDERVREAAESFGAQAVLTSPQHRSGTERIAEVVGRLGLDAQEIVVNLQGDEPLMSPALIRRTADTLAAHADAAVATACHPIRDRAEFDDPNIVKVVCDAKDFALYFSRASIPYPRDGGVRQARRHIGLYAYRAGFVARYVSWGPCPLEEIEQLEQLRVLWHGGRIVVCEARESPEAGVDTPQDLERVRKYFRSKLQVASYK